MDDAAQVPLHELLRSVPPDARLVIDDADGKGTSYIPVGRYCHEAAAMLAAAPQQQAEPVAAWRSRNNQRDLLPAGFDPDERFWEPLYTSPRITTEQVEQLKRLADEAMEASKQCAIAMMESSQPFNVAGLRPSLYGQTIGPEGVERKRAALHAALDALIAKEAP